MRNLIKTGGLTVVAALSVMALATQADASCSGRKTTGTVLGGAGGALLGHALFGGVGGALAGGVGGAVVGHEVGRSGCTTHATAYRTTRHHYVRRASYYYDSHGRRVYYR